MADAIGDWCRELRAYTDVTEVTAAWAYGAETRGTDSRAHGRSGVLCGVDVTAASLFDLASLTKPLVTTPIVVECLQRSGVPLTARVEELLPEWAARPGGASRGVTVRQLLTHSSGLPASLDPQPPRLVNARETMGRVLSEALVAAPGTRIAYSDLGFVVLAAMCTQVSGVPWRSLVTRHLGRWAALNAVACPVSAPVCPVPGVARGWPFDETAYALGGLAGNAGVFATVDGVRGLLGWWLARDARSRRSLLRPVSDGFGNVRGIGWAARGDKWDLLPPQWPATAVCHSGFTGTSIAWDPPSGAWGVLLTNAIATGRDKPGLTQVRRRFHTAVTEVLAHS